MFFKVIAGILMFLSVSGTLLPFTKSEAWYVRIMDFPRLQLFFIGLIGIITCVFTNQLALWEFIFLSLTSLSVIYQAWKIFPYTFLHKKQVFNKKVNPSFDTPYSFCVVISNVRMKNRKFQKSLNTWYAADPDLLFIIEANNEWEIHTRELEKRYPYFIKIPLENTYGMLLYSKLKLHDKKINYLVEDSVPSIECEVELQSGDKFHFYGLHPRPPAPAKSGTTLPRDTELLIIASNVKNKNIPVVVAGDLNDVAWSYTTHLFQNISGLLDPRIGRGMFSTYHAGIPFFRWPLDHLFHSSHFTFLKMKRLRNIGSDHFPILIHLNYESKTPVKHSEPEATSEDKEEAKEKMKKARKRNILPDKKQKKNP